MKKISKIIICLAAVFLYSCEYETLPTYSGEDNIYFYYAAATISQSNPPALVDSTTVMFGYDLKPKTDSLIVIIVRVLGSVTDYDRPVSFILEGNSSAQAGKDVILYPELSFVPAGSINGIIVIRVFNNEALLDGSSLVARLRLVENEHFKVDYTVSERFRGVAAARLFNAICYRVSFNNTNERPNMWTAAHYESQFTTSFGKYSREKFRLMCEILPGCTWEYFTYKPDEDPKDVFTTNFPIALVTGWSKTLYYYLEYYKEVNGEPLRDENGEEITSGSAYITG